MVEDVRACRPVYTYNFAHEDNVFASYEENAACNVSVSVANEDSLYCVLQYKVGFNDRNCEGEGEICQT